MNFTPEVVAALAVLRNAAENDFERHRLDVLERDLTAPPIVEVIDETTQKFYGLVYRKDSREHFSANNGIHRLVWTYYNGELPNGYEVHHVDGNPANNFIENLQALSKSEHVKLHNTKKPIEKVCPVCGKNFIIKSRKKSQKYCSLTCAHIHRRKYSYAPRKCPICGKEFTPQKENPYIKTCSRTCASKLTWKTKMDRANLR